MLYLIDNQLIPRNRLLYLIDNQRIPRNQMLYLIDNQLIPRNLLMITRLVEQIVTCVDSSTFLNDGKNNFVYSFLLLKHDLLKTTPTDEFSFLVLLLALSSG
jgi:hypothetical protein